MVFPVLEGSEKSGAAEPKAGIGSPAAICSVVAFACAKLVLDEGTVAALALKAPPSNEDARPKEAKTLLTAPLETFIVGFIPMRRLLLTRTVASKREQITKKFKHHILTYRRLGLGRPRRARRILGFVTIVKILLHCQSQSVLITVSCHVVCV